jgi:hypothetical protein
MSPAATKTLRTIVAILVAVAYLAFQNGWFGGGTGTGPKGAGSPSDAPPTSRTTVPAGDRRDSSAAYDPASAAPKDAIPGGGLRAHEGVDGGHTMDRHVGRTVEQLKRRLEQEDKREVSTFPDEVSADRFVAQALYARRADVARWLASDPTGNEAFPARLSTVAGSVLRRGASDVVPGRSVQVVLAPSRRFREGFRIVTAYVTLP